MEYLRNKSSYDCQGKLNIYGELSKKGKVNSNQYQLILALVSGKNSRWEKETSKGNNQRRLEERIKILPEEQLDLIPSQRLNPREVCERKEIIEISLNFIETNLSEKERKVMEGKYLSNLSFAEIGRNMGYSREYVSQIHKRAIKKLRKRLKNQT